jgi:hypothetical protein
MICFIIVGSCGTKELYNDIWIGTGSVLLGVIGLALIICCCGKCCCFKGKLFWNYSRI